MVKFYILYILSNSYTYILYIFICWAVSAQLSAKPFAKPSVKSSAQHSAKASTNPPVKPPTNANTRRPPNITDVLQRPKKQVSRHKRHTMRSRGGGVRAAGRTQI